MGKLIDLFWKKEANLIVGAYYSDTELSDMGYGVLEPHNWGGLSWQDSFIDVTPKEITNDRYALIYKAVAPLSNIWLGEISYAAGDEPGYKIVRRVYGKGEEPTIQPLEKFGHKKEAKTILIPGAIYVENDLLDEFEIRPVNHVSRKDLDMLDITKEEVANGNYYVIWEQPDFRNNSWLSKFKADERETHKIIRKLNPKDQEPKITPLEQFGTRTAQDEKESLYEVRTNIEENNRVEQEVYYDYTIKDIEDDWDLGDVDIVLIENLDINEEVNIPILTGLDYMTVTKIKQGLEDLPPTIEPLDKFGQRVEKLYTVKTDTQTDGIDELFNMSLEDITDSWPIYPNNKRVIKSLDVGERIEIDLPESIGQILITRQDKEIDFEEEATNFEVGNQVKVIHSTYRNPVVDGKIGTVKEIVGDSTIVVHFDDVGRHIITNKIVSMDLHFTPDQLEKVGIDIIPLEIFGKRVIGTGEMSMADIQPGGEDYEWAKQIEDNVKQIEERTGGKLKFEEMRPFDKYQGPYAVTNMGKVWSVYDDSFLGLDIFFIDSGMGQGLIGTIDLLSAAINDEGNARAVAIKNRELGWREKLDEISLDWDSGITPLEKFGQRKEYEIGDKVIIISGFYSGERAIITHKYYNTARREILYNVMLEGYPLRHVKQLDKTNLDPVDDEKEMEIKPLTQFGKLSNRKAVYSWSFAPEFYDSLRKALEKKISTDQVFRNELIKELGFNENRPPDYPPDDILVDTAMARAEMVNTVADLESPVEVWLDSEGYLTVEVPDKWEEEKEEEPKIKPLEVFG